MTGRKVWPLTLTKVTSVTVTKKQISKRDSGNDEGGSGDEKLHWAWLWTWWKVSMTWEMMTMTVEMKSYIGRESGHDWPLESVNVLSAIVVIKYYHKRDSGDYGKQGVTPQIDRCTECDIKDEKRPKA
jgi:hypothetical protein